VVIFALGLYLANLAAAAVEASGTEQARTLALTAQVSIIVLAGAMALQQMGVANEIITLAFGLLLGAVAVAAAIAFGWGGREMAAREVESWVRALHAQHATTDGPGSRVRTEQYTEPHDGEITERL
jgi:protein-S-isoprenylcysteine O-methyltransferase Ste14